MRRETPVLKQTEEISVLSMNITWREGGRGRGRGRGGEGKEKGRKERTDINDNKNSEIYNDNYYSSDCLN